MKNKKNDILIKKFINKGYNGFEINYPVCWEDLMSVVEKFASLQRVSITIFNNYCNTGYVTKSGDFYITKSTNKTLFNNVYETILKTIKLINKYENI